MTLLNAIFVVEGKHDSDRLYKCGIPYCVISEGTKVPRETINHLMALEKKHKIIILVDPDKPGEKTIRKLETYLEAPVIIRINKQKAIKKGTVGIENIALPILQDIVSPFLNKHFITKSDLTFQNLIDLSLTGPNSKAKRELVATRLNLLPTRLSKMYIQMLLLDITYEQLEHILNE